MKSALSKYSLTALGTVILLLSACGKKEEPVVAAPAAPAAVAAAPAMSGGEAAAKKWIDAEFQPSTLTKDQQTAELKWFIDAAKKLQAKGVKEISVVSETISTHEYESKTLAKAFSEITGINVKHDLIGEGDVVEKLQTSMQSGKSIYDGWISDSDLIGTHYRYGKILNLTDYMTGAGKEWTNPGLDLKDFIGTSCTNCLISSLQTYIGSAQICLPNQNCKHSSKPNMVMNLASL